MTRETRAINETYDIIITSLTRITHMLTQYHNFAKIIKNVQAS